MSPEKIIHSGFSVFVVFVDKIKEDDMNGSCSTRGRDQKCLPLSKSNFRWKDNIKLYLI
jgi:hypothetical protein